MAELKHLIESYLLDFNIEQAAKRVEFIIQDCSTISTRWHYVYALIDPTNSEIFYIGKGKDLRWQKHGIEGLKNSKKWMLINKIRNAGQEYRAIYLADGLTHTMALAIERDCIRSIGLKHLTNLSKGNRDAKMRTLIKALQLTQSLDRQSDHPWKERLVANAKRAVQLSVKDIVDDRA
jgi:hypothetical protein